MKLEDICIYSHIKDYLNEIEIVRYTKGQYITRSNQDLQEIFFILAGNIRVECITGNGRRFLVDELSEDEFVGRISYMYDQDFFCDIIATSDAELLRINKNTFKKLQSKPEFLSIFFFKTSSRIYYMYKKLMMKNLFKLEEILAYYILENSREEIFRFKSMYSLCEVLSISRKNLYNTVNKFIEKGWIIKEENSIRILDRAQLLELSAYVRDFNKTDNNDFKFSRIK